MAEAGVPDIVVLSWAGFFAPAGTSADIVKTLEENINGVLKLQKFASDCILRGSIQVGSTSQEFAQIMQRTSTPGRPWRKWPCDIQPKLKAVIEAAVVPRSQNRRFISTSSRSSIGCCSFRRARPARRAGYPSFTRITLDVMDANDIEIAITSVAQPGVQFAAPQEAGALARSSTTMRRN